MLMLHASKTKTILTSSILLQVTLNVLNNSFIEVQSVYFVVWVFFGGDVAVK